MRNILIFVSVLIGLGLLINTDIFSSWSSIILLLILLIGFLYMFTGKILPQLMESLLLILLIPIFTIFIIHFICVLFSSFQVVNGSEINFPFIILILILMTAATIYVIRRRMRNRRPDAHRLQGSERESVMSTPLHDVDEHDNIHNP